MVSSHAEKPGRCDSVPEQKADQKAISAFAERPVMHEVTHRRRRLRSPSILAVIGVFLLSGCSLAPSGDSAPRPLAMGRTDDGRFRFVVPLCEGENVLSFEVQDHRTERLVWKASQPTRSAEREGSITLGDAQGFTTEESPLSSPLPPDISVDVQVTSDAPIGRGFLFGEAPKEMSGTDLVTAPSGARIPEKQFRQETIAEYC
ncbi:hypothetical protein [Nonomuraea sp. NPDC049646]|uniref:hypothetical protein n=1 Tax=unclassified Nonomuraea TaxID=2593643 RepID=UPI0037B4E2BD